LEQRFNTATEVSRGSDEAEDEEAVGGEVVEVACVDGDVVLAEEMNGEVFIGGVH